MQSYQCALSLFLFHVIVQHCLELAQLCNLLSATTVTHTLAIFGLYDTKPDNGGRVKKVHRKRHIDRGRGAGIADIEICARTRVCLLRIKIPYIDNEFLV